MKFTLLLGVVLFMTSPLAHSQTTDTIYTCDVTDASEVGADDGFIVFSSTGLTNPSYAWETAPPAYGPAVTNLDRGVYYVKVTDDNGFSDTAWCAVGEPFVSCEGLRTQTQGGWGQKARGGNAGAYRDANFDLAFPGGISIGCDGGFSLTLTSAEAVKDFLPSGSTPKVLTQDLTDPGRSYKNVFAGQVMALSLSVGFDNADPYFAYADMYLEDQIVAYGVFADWTVGDLLAEANSLLGGCGSSYSMSALHNAVTSINENFVDGKRTGGYLNCLAYMGSSIGDYVWNDLNGNGQHDPGEPGIEGVEVKLTYEGPDGVFGTGDDVVYTTTTDAQGVYEFEGLMDVGDYELVINEDVNTALTGYNLTGGQDIRIIELLADMQYIYGDNGYQKQNSSISSIVYEDYNGNGQQDIGEPSLVDVTVKLTSGGVDGVLGTSDDVVFTTTTDANGAYSFNELPANEYAVEVEDDLSSGGYVRTEGGDPTFVSLGDDQSAEDSDFGFQPFSSSVGNEVFADVDGDGVRDTEDFDIDGVDVHLLYYGQDDLAGTADDVDYGIKTTINGSYLFESLPQGTYEVTVVTESAPVQYFSTTSTSFEIFVAANSEYLDADYGFQPRNSSISGTAFEDVNGNGVEDAGDSGLSGVIMTLTEAGDDGTFGTSDDVVLGTETADASGNYSFTGLPAGNYKIDADESTAPADYDLSSASASTEVTLGVGQDEQDVDFGFQPFTSSLSGTIWDDVNGDGVRDAGEDGLAGVTVEATWDGSDEIYPSADDVSYITTTDSFGYYEFTNLPAGTYEVTIDENTLPAGYEPTGSSSSTEPLGVASSNNDGGFGFNLPKGTIRGVVWDDLDGDGLREAGEPVVEGIVVTLLYADGSLTGINTTTDANGAYSFDDVQADNYKLAFSGLPADYVYTVSGGDSKADQTTGETSAFTLSGGSLVGDQDAGIALPGKVEMTVVASVPFLFRVQPVTYTYTVINTGGVPLDAISWDSGDCIPTYTSGDTNGDNKIQSDETWTYKCTKLATWSIGQPVVTSPTCNCTDVVGEESQSSATSIIPTFGPNMDIDVAQSTVCAGDTLDVTLVSRMVVGGDIGADMDVQFYDFIISVNLIADGATWLAGPNSDYWDDPSGDYVNTRPGAMSYAIDYDDFVDIDNGNYSPDWVHKFQYVVPSDHTGDLLISAWDKAAAHYYVDGSWNTFDSVRIGFDELTIASGCPQAVAVDEDFFNDIFNPEQENEDLKVENDEASFSGDLIFLDVNERQEDKIGLSVYPNPFVEHVNIQLDETLENSRIQIFNASGLLLREVRNVQYKVTIDGAMFAYGVNYIKIMKGDQTIVKKVVKL